MSTPRADIFLSCDWGTTAFRLHLVEASSGRSLAGLTTSEGAMAIHRDWQTAGSGDNREAFFLNVVRGNLTKLNLPSGHALRRVPLVMSGMVTSSIGLREIPHQRMPFALDGSDLRVERSEFRSDEIGPVLLISGARTDDDMMRGEEIQLVGAHALGAERDAWFILPGTHSKHVTVERGHAVELRTFMTGEFFELLVRRSILANSIEAGPARSQRDSDAAFREGVITGVTENLLHASFGVRVAELNGRRSRSAGYHYLSGLLIGSELKELRSRAPGTIFLVGTVALTTLYTQALQTLGYTAAINAFEAELAVIAGHRLVARRAGMIE